MLDVMAVPCWDDNFCIVEEMPDLFYYGTTTSKKIPPFPKVTFAEGIECPVICLIA